MNYHKMLQLMLTVTVCASILVGCGGPATPTAKPRPTAFPTPTPVMATLYATDGKIYEVANLFAKYEAGGMWIGTRPSRVYPKLMVALRFSKDRVSTTENIEYPLASIQRIVFKDASIPENLKVEFDSYQPIRIELRNGSIILLSNKLLIELDAAGQQTRRVAMDNYGFDAGEDQGQKITLRGFSGGAKTATGANGIFWITLNETKSIEWD